MRWTLCQQRDEQTDGFYTNSTNIKNGELKSLAVSLDETVRNGDTFNEHLSCDAECEKTNRYLLKGQSQLLGPSSSSSHLGFHIFTFKDKITERSDDTAESLYIVQQTRVHQIS